MSRHFSDPTREDDDYALPDVEVFYADAGDLPESEDGEPSAAGWYYWFCFPGCMPDSDAFGPYDTEEDAIAAMREEHGP